MKKLSGSATSRVRVFVLADGTSVVQWDEKRVQELLSGQYRHYDHQRDFGHAITDYELNVLKANGRVEHYTQKYVWLFPLPEAGRHEHRVLDGLGKVRGYYLTTGSPKSELTRIRALLETLGLLDILRPSVRGNAVVLHDPHGQLFSNIEEAEQTQQKIIPLAKDLFGEISVAFVEMNNKRSTQPPETAKDDETLPSLDDLIASQHDVSTTSGRKVVLASAVADEREVFTELLTSMKIEVFASSRGADALALLEDVRPDLFIMDMQLPDTHGYLLLGRVREIDMFRDLPVLIIADESSVSMTIAKIDYLTRPVSIARLRFTVWRILRDRPPSAR